MAKPIHLVIADDEYVAARTARAVVDDVVPPEEQSLRLEIIDGGAGNASEALAAIDACEQALLTRAFLGGPKAVWLQNAAFLGDGGAGRAADVKDRRARLIEIMKSLDPRDAVFVISTDTIDKRQSFFKTCRKSGEVHDKTARDKKAAAATVREEIRKALKEEGLQMTAAVGEAFLQRVGTDARQIRSEMSKLRNYMGERRRVEIEDVRAVVSATGTALVWDLTDALGGRDLPAALRTVRQLLFQKENPIGLLVQVESLISNLIVFRTALENGWLRKGPGSRDLYEWGEVPPEAERLFAELLPRDPRAQHPYRIHVLARQAAGFSMAGLTRLRRLAVDSHAQLVTGAASQQAVLELMLIKMLGRRSSSRVVQSPA